MLFCVHRIRKCRPLQALFITVWLEVRVLPAPPRSPTLTEISRSLTNTRGFAGRRAGLQSLQGRRTASEAVRGLLSLAIQKPFPRSVARRSQRLGSLRSPRAESGHRNRNRGLGDEKAADDAQQLREHTKMGR